MEAQEFRIGNCIQYFIETDNLGWQDLKWLSEQPESFTSQHRPIRLTEEILLKCGFEKKNHTWSDKSVSIGLFFKNGYYVENSREGFLFCQLHYSGQGWFFKNTEYLHQLQNLYFALTGQELEINL